MAMSLMMAVILLAMAQRSLMLCLKRVLSKALNEAQISRISEH